MVRIVWPSSRPPTARGRETPPEACHAEPTGRPTAPSRSRPRRDLHRQSRALQIEEALIFEIGRTDVTGVDLDGAGEVRAAPRQARAHGRRSACPASPSPRRCATTCGFARRTTASTPGSSARLLHDEAQSAPQREDGAAAGLRRHPSAAAALDRAGRARADRRARRAGCCELTGMPAVAMTPKAGAHGELCGMMAIKAALAARGEKRAESCWCRNSAHGTNPATAALLGYRGRGRPGARRRHGRPRGGASAALAPTSPRSC